MRYKQDRSTGVMSRVVFGMKAFVAAEVVCLAGSYYFWRKMNRSQEFRYKVHQKCPSILEVFYQMGERIGSLETRQFDQEAWGINDK